MNSINVRAITEEERTELRFHTEAGMELLGFPDDASPDAIVYAVFRYVETWQARRHDSQYSPLLSSGPDGRQISLGLGVVWGNQIVRELAWEWMIVKHSFAVVAPEQKYAVRPTLLLLSHLYAGSGGWDENIVAQLYNQLKTDTLPPLSRQLYQIIETEAFPHENRRRP